MYFKFCICFILDGNGEKKIIIFIILDGFFFMLGSKYSIIILGGGYIIFILGGILFCFLSGFYIIIS